LQCAGRARGGGRGFREAPADSPALTSGFSPYRSAWRASMAPSVRSAGAEVCVNCRRNPVATPMINSLCRQDSSRPPSGRG
jgi:hypothetical protein